MIDLIESGKLKTEKARAEFEYAHAEAVWAEARKQRPMLEELPALNRHELVEVFCELEKSRIKDSTTEVLAKHFEQMPRGTMGEMGLIRGEIGRKRGHKSIRWLMKNAGGMIQRIKPVALMSPISVAQFLPPGSVTYDLLVIDEASQIRPEEALGAVARARQIIVVGDQKQLPPTSFFGKLIDEEDEIDEEETVSGANAADMESILTLCESRGLRQRMLEWHYRSRDPSLIQISNAEFYNDGLILPPSPLQLDPDFGLKLTRVPGVYARGGTGLGRQGTNRIEAEEIAKAVAKHARDTPSMSLGIVAFSKAQADMLTEVMEFARRQDATLDRFLQEGNSEDVFIKNIENVQGDERDVILISVGYGPQEPNGRLRAMSFGPVNGEGGERRLNVLFSRARIRCEVFTSFDPRDIDPSKVKRDGPRVLKRFLEFAQTGIAETKEATGLEADSPFEVDVAGVIKSLGYLADPQVGSAGFRIDIGVRHPSRSGNYILAVECDGAAYHRALWARERDRSRQATLENLGWRFHRIWSTDWFTNRSGEIERLKAALEAALEASERGIEVRGSYEAKPEPVAVPPTEPPEQTVEPVEEVTIRADRYKTFEGKFESELQPHEVDVSELGELIMQIVEVEGPIHFEEISRRVTTAFGLSRAGRRIADATMTGIEYLSKNGSILIRDEKFALVERQSENMPIRDRSSLTGGLIKAKNLSPSEIKAAASKITAECGAMPDEEMCRAICRLLGFKRVGSELSTLITRVLKENQAS